MVADLSQKGPTGGPCEDSITGMLVRSTSTSWGPDSMIAVDAGTLLCGLKNVLETSDDNGPFSGMAMPYKTAKANAAHILREIVGPVLVTHAHLDHISGFVVNTPILEASSGPKRLTALPSVISAFKEHMFNEILWPNLTDEDGGAGLITFQRLVEGGNPHMGRGEEKGYVRACEGLTTRCFAVSHGRCKRPYQQQPTTSTPDLNPRRLSLPSSADPVLFQDSFVDRPLLSPATGQSQSSQSPREVCTAVESSAFFIRDHASGIEIIIFGDIEPDSISIHPRNQRVWEKAAPKVLSKVLRAIFIECSYDNSVSDEFLYGHLCPRHLIKELKVLARLVFKLKHGAGHKRKRATPPEQEHAPEEPPSAKQKSGRSKSHSSAKGTQRGRGRTSTVTFADTPSGSLAAANDDIEETTDDIKWSEEEKPLEGLTIFLIHIKDDMSEDEPVAERILSEVTELAETENLGCTIRVPGRGENILI
ncbi:hypothetical protein P170DRAFT_497547 [Aspergillus steynii IBT 23096]|uniref:cAMP-specific phosphodiesterase n=1 Tax=Aspergillus steynii IBT 23096 TaxID=1392250 RepID=A0A2I2G5V6_9EURO|nr:uncharacterized protein P170DRAFT_497547 [Aspergillus steynii IBT 23096]PLB48262.1 hypothetical protein P170DRAFT_497547 [Aspergillus steynii IBT 23096]